jgi:DNA-binding beta-propeller fold protein YncE
MGTAVGICGTNFDTQAENNLVYFGTLATEVLTEGQPADAQPAADFQCDSDLLWVRVPSLPTEDPVSIKVSTAAGQAVSEKEFVYDGPGHPLSGMLKKKLEIRAGLWSVVSPSESSAKAFGTIGVESNVIGIFEDFYGLHLDFGLCDTPLSAAPAITDTWEFVIYISHMRFKPGADFGVDANLTRWRVNLPDLVNGIIEEPQSVSIDDLAPEKPFVPKLVWTFPRVQQFGFVEHDVIVTHMKVPALAVIPVEDPARTEIITIPGPPFCSQGEDDSLGPVVDLVYDSQAKEFYLALEGGNEIWRVPAEPPHDPTRVYPPDTEGALVNCRWIISSLALRRSGQEPEDLRLYLADAMSLRVLEMKLAGAGNTQHLSPTNRATAFDSIPYDMVTGRYPSVTNAGIAVTGERLYVATQNGLSIIDVSDPTPATPNIDFKPVGEIPVPRNRGGQQSLAVRDEFNLLTEKADTILFVDANSDQVLQFTVGNESILQSDTAAGSTFPYLSTSYRGRRLYLSDVLSNTVHVIDRNSGLRSGQFPIASIENHATMGVGSMGMTTLRRPDHDLLIMPLTEVDPDNLLQLKRFRPIAFARISDELPECGLTSGGLKVDESVEQLFEQMELVTWDLEGRNSVPVLVLTRFFELFQPEDGSEPIPRPGSVVCLEIDPEGERLITDELAICNLEALVQLNSKVHHIRAYQHAPILVQLETVASAQENPVLGIRLRDLQAGGQAADPGKLRLLDIELLNHITHMAVMRRGSQGTLYQVYLALPRLGVVLVATFDSESDEVAMNTIPTGGDPSLLSVSPDERRLYVTHFFGGQVSVIQTDCMPVGQCENVESTIDLDAWPGPVVFDDTGRAAYVLHFQSSDISWIE